MVIFLAIQTLGKKKALLHDNKFDTLKLHVVQEKKIVCLSLHKNIYIPNDNCETLLRNETHVSETGSPPLIFFSLKS